MLVAHLRLHRRGYLRGKGGGTHRNTYRSAHANVAPRLERPTLKRWSKMALHVKRTKHTKMLATAHRIEDPLIQCLTEYKQGPALSVSIKVSQGFGQIKAGSLANHSSLKEWPFAVSRHNPAPPPNIHLHALIVVNNYPKQTKTKQDAPSIWDLGCFAILFCSLSVCGELKCLNKH